MRGTARRTALLSVSSYRIERSRTALAFMSRRHASPANAPRLEAARGVEDARREMGSSLRATDRLLVHGGLPFNALRSPRSSTCQLPKRADETFRFRPRRIVT